MPKNDPGPPPYDIKLTLSSVPVIPYKLAASLIGTCFVLGLTANAIKPPIVAAAEVTKSVVEPPVNFVPIIPAKPKVERKRPDDAKGLFLNWRVSFTLFEVSFPSRFTWYNNYKRLCEPSENSSVSFLKVTG